MKISELEWLLPSVTLPFMHPSGNHAWVQVIRGGEYVFFVNDTREFDQHGLDTFDLAMLLIPCTPIPREEETP